MPNTKTACIHHLAESMFLAVANDPCFKPELNPETGTHYDSEVEVSEEEGEESDKEKEPYGSNCTSEKESQNSSDEY